MDNRRIEERYCPQLAKNIPLEITYSPDGLRREQCMAGGECGCGRQGCQHLSQPPLEKE